MQQNNVQKILSRINRKLNEYCPKSSPNIKPYFTLDEAVSGYQNTHSITEKYINQESLPHPKVSTYSESNMRSQLEQHKRVISKLKKQNEKLNGQVSFLQKRVQNLQRRASSESVSKKSTKKEISRISSRQQIQSSFYSNCLPPKLKKKSIKVKKKK